MLTESKLNEVLSRASMLMSPEGQRIIESHRKQNVQSFDADGNYIPTSNSKESMQKPTQMNNIQSKSSGLPRAIRESILQNPLDASATEFNVSTSVLDSIPVKPQRKIVTEQQYQPQPMSVDYNYIRSIINECIQSNLQQIKNEILQESQLKAIRIGGENKIQLIDNKNNLFESKLEFKKNISKNK